MADSGERETILVVDDQADTLEMLQRKLVAEGFKVFTAPEVGRALNLLRETPVDLVVTDLKMPGASGLDLVRYVRENLEDTAVMMITGYATVSGAVEAVRCGAEDYLPKPFTDEELFDAVNRALEKLRARRISRHPEQARSFEGWGILGRSEPMLRLYRTIERAATATATVLISGESGTGKELVARAIHYSSTRSKEPFVPVNCGAIPQELFESELFGHTRGAFTGAREARHGFFQAADRGTIFLDEVAETGAAMQIKLLRVLQDHQVFPVGAREPQDIDVRVTAATNKDLDAAVRRNDFREDLFYRLNVLTIETPPLRERGDDILLLATAFAEQFSRELGKPAPRFRDETLEAFLNYDWPGNVREMENLVQRLVVMQDEDSIAVHDLPRGFRTAPPSTGLHRSLAEVEAEHICNVLASVGGNKTQAAQILGIDRKTLREKLKHFEGGPS